MEARRRDQGAEAAQGSRTAIVAVAAALLNAAYAMLRDGEPYRDLGATHFAAVDKKKIAAGLARRLRKLGYEVQMRAAA